MSKYRVVEQYYIIGKSMMRVGGKKKIVVHQSYLKVLDMNFITINYYLGLTKKQ